MQVVEINVNDELRIENSFYSLSEDEGYLTLNHVEDASDKIPLIAEIIKDDGTSIPLKPYDTIIDGYGNSYMLIDGVNGTQLVDKTSLYTDEFQKALQVRS